MRTLMILALAMGLATHAAADDRRVPEKVDGSVDKVDISADMADVSVDTADISVDTAGISVDRAIISADRADISADTADIPVGSPNDISDGNNTGNNSAVPARDHHNSHLGIGFSYGMPGPGMMNPMNPGTKGDQIDPVWDDDPCANANCNPSPDD